MITGGDRNVAPGFDDRQTMEDLGMTTDNEAIISYAFGKTCEMTANLDKSFDDLFERVHERMQEIGGSTHADRHAVSVMERAATHMRHLLAKDMTDAYLKVYAEVIEARSYHD